MRFQSCLRFGSNRRCCDCSYLVSISVVLFCSTGQFPLNIYPMIVPFSPIDPQVMSFSMANDFGLKGAISSQLRCAFRWRLPTMCLSILWRFFAFIFNVYFRLGFHHVSQKVVWRQEGEQRRRLATLQDSLILHLMVFLCHEVRGCNMLLWQMLSLNAACVDICKQSIHPKSHEKAWHVLLHTPSPMANQQHAAETSINYLGHPAHGMQRQHRSPAAFAST